MCRTIGEVFGYHVSSAIADLAIRRPNIFFNITSPTPGTFIIALHYKGRERAILEMDLKIDDLLEKVGLLLLSVVTCVDISRTRSNKTTSIY